MAGWRLKVDVAELPCVLTLLVMNKQKMGIRVNISKHSQFDPHFQSRFFFSPVDLYTGKEGRPHMRPRPARTIAVYSYFFVQKSRL